MKIYFDYKIFFIQKYGGISKYFIKLSENLLKISNNKIKIIAPIFKNKYLKSFNQSNTVKFIYLEKNYKNTELLGNYININFTKLYYYLNTPDIFHLTYYSNQFYLKKRSPIILTVYDLIYEKYHNVYNYKKNLKSEYLKNADHIICISNNTKKDLQHFYDVDDKKISVVYLGVDKLNYNNILDINHSKPYILYVGERKKYKNFYKFIKAFSLSKNLKKNYKIICFGGGSFSKDEVNFFLQNKLDLNCIEQQEGDDTYLNSFYKNASLFVFPSLSEGFGLPLIESLSMRCPVACSDIETFREIGGNLVNYFDPNDEISIRKVMEYTIDNIRHEKIKILHNSKILLSKFNWKKCATETNEVYKKVL
jgi:glycosyltransferase involved in cell wall biosynthesis